MARIAAQNLRPIEVGPLIINSLNFHYKPLNKLPSSWFCSFPSHYIPKTLHITHAKKKNSRLEPVLRPSTIENVAAEKVDDDADDNDDDDDIIDDFEDGEFTENDFEDEYEAEEAELYAGDGGGGGGISLAGTSWDKEALAMAEEVSSSLDGDLKIYAFKTLANSTIQVRIEKLSNKLRCFGELGVLSHLEKVMGFHRHPRVKRSYISQIGATIPPQITSGSPNLSDIEAFSSAYRERLDEAEGAGIIPGNVSLEVSSPGAERVVQIPQDLDRFKDRAMYVKYIIATADESGTDLSTEGDGIFRLVSFDLELRCCTWGIADVRINREKAGKGRPLNKKQRDWRLNTPFHSLRLVRLYCDV